MSERSHEPNESCTRCGLLLCGDPRVRIGTARPEPGAYHLHCWEFVKLGMSLEALTPYEAANMRDFLVYALMKGMGKPV